MMITNREWVEFVFSDLPAGCAPVYAAFEGDPCSLTPQEKGKAFYGRGVGVQWGGHGSVVFRDVAAEFNTYINVASFQVEQSSGRLVQGKSHASYGGLHAVFIDDVRKKIKPKDNWLEPTLVIETSPGNEQWWYALSVPIIGHGAAEQFVRGFVAKVPNDGQGAIRWGRLPVGANMKYAPAFKHRVIGGMMRKYSKEEMVSGFGGLLLPPIAMERGGRAGAKPENALEHKRKENGDNLIKWLRSRGMVKREYADRVEIVCPLGTGHDNGNGTVVYFPSGENDWIGGFKCQHLKCAGKHIGHLYNWLEKGNAQRSQAALPAGTAALQAPAPMQPDWAARN